MEREVVSMANVKSQQVEELEQEGAALPGIPRHDDGEVEPGRRRRRRRVRARTIAVKRLTKEQLRIGRLLYPETDYWKPRTREECTCFERPCPYVSCKHHLFLDVNPLTGSIKLNFPDLEVWEMEETCALDVADRGGITLEEVGEIMNLTRERIRQVELRGLEKLRDGGNTLKEYH
jgi:hypothetical protein